MNDYKRAEKLNKYRRVLVQGKIMHFISLVSGKSKKIASPSADGEAMTGFQSSFSSKGLP